MGMMRHHRPVTTQRREGAVSVQASLMLVNDRFGDMRCVATKALSRLRTDAASAKVGNPRSVLSGIADLGADRSECPQSAPIDECASPFAAPDGPRIMATREPMHPVRALASCGP
ncbi:hypothetical protein THS5294_00140 [Thalassobacter stenotrophicus]|uniref:Uncharacterized protein n=2 Tax=Thalassobacter stenotrophicus TaxID=266809 RepID=A0A0P1FGV2_9RHOB|nr:hypothetical protein THS5294_00140 [Thalassobacter stenotrophicus]SHJ33469.1 hypothetical protein SAMN02744035_03414 [Thalassobacter stenotrophicus DSM 16310]